MDLGEVVNKNLSLTGGGDYTGMLNWLRWCKKRIQAKRYNRLWH